jgi:hypothetical protein
MHPTGGPSERFSPRSIPMRDPSDSPIDSAPRVRAPEFPDGLDWINTGGRPVSLGSLRGRVILLDFWTYG